MEVGVPLGLAWVIEQGERLLKVVVVVLGRDLPVTGVSACHSKSVTG